MRLTKRERGLAFGMTAVVVIWALHVTLVAPTRNRIRTLERIVPQKRAELRELQARIAEYVTQQERVSHLRAKIAGRNADLQLVPFVETLIDAKGLARHVTSMVPNTINLQSNYSETIVEVELRDMSLEQLIDLVTAIENSTVFAQVESLHVRRSSENGALVHSTIQVHSPQLSSGALASHVPAS